MSADLFADVTGRRRIEIPDIGDGFWIEVRQELSVGEQRAIYARAFKGLVELPHGETRSEYDMGEVSFGIVCAYLVDWDDKREVTPDAIRALKPEVYNPIELAVQTHVEELRKNARAAQPKGHKSTSRKSTPKTGAAPISLSAAG